MSGIHKSRIEWCDSTWNPVSGCLHACPYCYAAKGVKRFQPQTSEWPEVMLQHVGRAGNTKGAAKITEEGASQNGLQYAT